MTSISNNAAISAYQKVLQSSKAGNPQQTLKLAEQTMKVLRAGDDLTVSNSAKANPNNFTEVAKQVVAEKVSTIKETDAVAKKAFMPTTTGAVNGTNNIDLVRAYNEADATLMLVQEVRAQFVSALQEIIKTPL